MKSLLVCMCAFLAGCASVNLERADWCVSKGKFTVSIPLDPYPHQHKCKAREILKRITG